MSYRGKVWISAAVASAIFWLVLVLALLINAAIAAGIPPEAARYRLPLTQTVQAYCGLGCPVADFAAQIHQESRYRSDAVSPVGARGMAQFMPATSKWISGVYPGQLGANKPADPQWAMRALVLYDRWLWDRTRAADDCNHLAKVKSAYNGGLGWVYKSEKIAKSSGLDAARWWGNIETVNDGRTPAALRENHDYPRLILTVYAPMYAAAGWGRRACA